MNIPVKELTFGLFARNPVLITKYSGIDPETSLTGGQNGVAMDYFNLPNTQSYGINLNIKF
jgi:hypothetical protein